MKLLLLRRFAVLAILSSLAHLSLAATAEQAANSISAETVGQTVSASEDYQHSPFFDVEELAELAALEAENADLEEQTAGFFGPRLGTIIVIVVVLVLIL